MKNVIENFKSGVWGNELQETSIWNKWIHRNLSDNHCSECLMLDGCWFEKTKTPKHPHHPFCHCVLETLSNNIVKIKSEAYSVFSKYDPYLFNRDNAYSHQKQILFEEWGYTIEDAKWLKNEIEKQCLENYRNGNYQLGRLNEQGQRISIRVEIPNKTHGGMVSFITGWMIRPNGQITLNTPYGGK